MLAKETETTGIIVADTSPLNYMVRLGRVPIMRSRFRRVLVPAAVLKELRHADAPLEVRVWALQPPPWIEVLSPHAQDVTLPMALGEGERQAISLAMELGLAILLDDRTARREAESRRVPVIGTLALLRQASLQGQVDLHSEIIRLRMLGFRLSPEAEESALR